MLASRSSPVNVPDGNQSPTLGRLQGTPTFIGQLPAPAISVYVGAQHDQRQGASGPARQTGPSGPASGAAPCI